MMSSLLTPFLFLIPVFFFCCCQTVKSYVFPIPIFFGIKTSKGLGSFHNKETGLTTINVSISDWSFAKRKELVSLKCYVQHAPCSPPGIARTRNGPSDGTSERYKQVQAAFNLSIFIYETTTYLYSTDVSISSKKYWLSDQPINRYVCGGYFTNRFLCFIKINLQL
jgi:hypothetical protein